MATDEKMATSGISMQPKQQFLTFTLGSSEYGVKITDIQEVRGWEGVNALPRTPKCIAGIISLRNNIIPVIDLRLRLNLIQREYDDKTVVAIIKMRLDVTEQLVGIVVDSVSDVLDATSDQIKNPPNFGKLEDSAIIAGLISNHDNMVIIIDAGQLISKSELVNLDGKIKMYGAMAGGE